LKKRLRYIFRPPLRDFWENIGNFYGDGFSFTGYDKENERFFSENVGNTLLMKCFNMCLLLFTKSKKRLRNYGYLSPCKRKNILSFLEKKKGEKVYRKYTGEIWTAVKWDWEKKQVEMQADDFVGKKIRIVPFDSIDFCRGKARTRWKVKEKEKEKG